MDLLKTLAQRILPEIEKDIRRIVKDLVSEYTDGMKELKALSKALLKGKPGKAAKVAGKRKMSKVAKARISKALKKAWARKKGAKKVKTTTKKPAAAPVVEANKGV
jgi:hypothetical protein